MQSLLKFPNELLFQISSDLTIRDLNALLRTNKFFSRLLTSSLHTLAAQDVCGAPALVWAAGRGHEPLIRYLLEKAGVDINACDPTCGVTALHKAAINGDERVVELLLEKGARVDPMEYKMGATPLHWAALYGRRGVAGVLLENGADANRVSSISQRTPLQMAVVSRHCLEGRWLQLKEGKPSTVGVCLDELRRSAGKAVEEVVMTLLKHGASTQARDSTGKTVLHLAIKHAGKWAYNDSQVPRLLIDAGAGIGVVDNLGWTELHTAALHGSANIVRLLLERGADIEGPGPSTPLHVAIHNGKLEVFRLLLEKGANVDIGDRVGKTPLHEAVLGAPPELRRLLPKSKVDVIQEGKEEMVRLLLSRKAKINTLDPQGNTALHYAVSVRDPATINLLLENDVEADITIQDSEGRTPLQYAEENGWTSIAKVLMEKEAKLKTLGRI